MNGERRIVEFHNLTVSVAVLPRAPVGIFSSRRLAAHFRPKPPGSLSVATRSITTAAICCLLCALTGCVLIPYRPKPEYQHSTPATVNSNRVGLSLSPPKLIEKLAKATLRQDKRLQRIDGKAFMAALSPQPELTLAQLLDPSTHARIKPMHVDYLVLFSKPISATLSSKGGGGIAIGYAGAAASTESTCYQAAVIDLHKLQLIDRLSSKAVGKDAAIGLFFAVGVISDTEGSARKGVIGQVIQTIAQVRPTGTVRVVFLTGEGIQ